METFRDRCTAYFEPLVSALALTSSAIEDRGMYGSVEGRRDNVCVRFEQDRGLCEFVLSPTSAPEISWNLLLVASLFPRVRLLSTGEQRLSLTEQAQLIQANWAELQRLLSPSVLVSTIPRLQAENGRRLEALGMKTPAKQ
jgi:hypothetical protein